ncbi:spinster family MFS transporter [Eilatimonas milleporae]|uniref:Putative MFS family arabinose efflux permease n=1 Tax=Eilatimonas milleporae TaxID=911205 RepID=A0A3M0CW66_9PROT|nr:MFS transporter [Eilatimonas milleporae]RMB13075.1 putative MFS family arabinose efflux permease [Eilatimonas milleporae]
MRDVVHGGAMAPPQRLRRYTLFILTIVYAFNFIDRQILVVMQELIKTDLGLNDTQLGMLSGLAFALFYTVIGIPVAWMSDRTNRRDIIALALAIWSGMTALSGLVQSFWQLAAARVGVGVGEAGCSPPAHSMISDLYEPKRRATALSIYSSGLYLGVLLGYLLGGFLSEAYGWRTTFLILGIPGVLLAVLLRLSVPEPVRTLGGASEDTRPGFVESLHYVAGLKSFRYFALACAMSAFFSYGTGNFMASFLIRYHGFSVSEVGIALALTGGLGGMAGTFLGGYLTDRVGRRDARWYLWLPGISAVLAVPLALVAFNVEGTAIVLGTYLLAAILGTMYLAPSIAVAHRLVEPRMRAVASALLFFVLNLIGLGLGPLMVGGISDILREMTGRESLREALTIAVSIVLVKALLFWQGGRKLPEDLQKRDS